MSDDTSADVLGNINIGKFFKILRKFPFFSFSYFGYDSLSVIVYDHWTFSEKNIFGWFYLKKNIFIY